LHEEKKDVIENRSFLWFFALNNVRNVRQFGKSIHFIENKSNYLWSPKSILFNKS
jgi:hypothetical protein